MVFQDISQSFNSYKKQETQTSAHLMDRFFSFLIDYLVISPFVFFILYLCFGEGIVLWKSQPSAPENDAFFLILAFGFVFFFGLIQSLFITVWRATPGQYFLKIKLNFNETENLIFFRAFIRQTTYWLSFLLFGVPFFSMLTNKSRRTFYDRLADVTVLSLKNEADFFVFDKEVRYWQSFMATVFIFSGFLVLSVVWRSYERVLNRVESFNQLSQQQYFCPSMSDVKFDDRLQVAIGLNLVDQLSDDCLDREADFVLWKEKKSDYSLAYYAKSLTAEDDKQESKYLIQACEGQNLNKNSDLTFGCKVAQAFQNNEFEQFYSSLKEDNFISDVLKYEISLSLNLIEQAEAHLAKIEKYNNYKAVKKYQITELLAKDLDKKNNRQPASSDKKEDKTIKEKIIELVGDL